MKRAAFIFGFIVAACAAGLLHMYSTFLNSIFLSQWSAQLEFKVSPMVVATYIGAYLIWAVVSIVTFFLLERFLVKAKVAAKLGLYLAGAVVWIPLQAWLENLMYAASNGSTVRAFQFFYLTLQPTQAFFKFVIYSLIFGVCAFLVYQRHYKSARESLLATEVRLAKEASEKAEYQLKSLQAKLNPHFLFNSLNSISGMVRSSDQGAVLHTIAVLGDLLRYSIQASDETFVGLREEIEFTRNFIAIQEVRFGSGIQIEIEIPDELPSTLCPPFCLHTLVENAFKHSSAADGGISAAVRIACTDTEILVRVRSQPAATGGREGPGTGLLNLSKRLRLLYGHRASLATSLEGRVFTANLVFPKGSEVEQ